MIAGYSCPVGHKKRKLIGRDYPPLSHQQFILISSQPLHRFPPSTLHPPPSTLPLLLHKQKQNIYIYIFIYTFSRDSSPWIDPKVIGSQHRALPWGYHPRGIALGVVPSGCCPQMKQLSDKGVSPSPSPHLPFLFIPPCCCCCCCCC